MKEELQGVLCTEYILRYGWHWQWKCQLHRD